MNSQPRPSLSAPPVLRLEGEMTIFRAAELKTLLTGEPAVEAIDLSGVTDIDTAGVQLLLVASRAARRAQRPLQLVAPSAAVKEVLDLLALSAGFDEGQALAADGGDAGRSAAETTRTEH